LGSATVTASSGVPPYTYLWSNGDTTATTTGLDAGIYTIRVTDAGGCYSLFTTAIYASKSSYDYSTIGTNFNGTPVSPGTYIWFSAVANITYNGSYPLTVRFINQNITSSKFNVIPANARLIITNAVTQATTVFTGGEWVTTAPPNLSGNYFISGYAMPVSLAIPAYLNPVIWKGVWTTSSSCVSNIEWKWSAAAYSGLTANHTQIDVKPVDDNSATIYNNSNLAGTPENYAFNCIAGGLSTGGSDYVGIYSPKLNRIPCSVPDNSCAISPRLSFVTALDNKKSDFIINAYPNPFSSKTYIEFQKIERASHLVIDVYSFYGQKIRTIFEDDIEAGAIYRTEFDAGDLVEGIYIYRLIGDEEEVTGKLILSK
jgi:hypothetical protein